MRMRPIAMVCFAVAAVALSLSKGALPARADEGPRVIPVAARRFEFSPARISIVKGETVTLRVTSEDVTHGFFQRDLGIDADLAPGQPADVTLTPKVAGAFTVICDHFCGAQHGGMKMTIVVE
ncbi:MAG: cupredoxin domain-containing protein [Acidobacteriota bacterium]